MCCFHATKAAIFQRLYDRPAGCTASNLNSTAVQHNHLHFLHTQCLLKRPGLMQQQRVACVALFIDFLFSQQSLMLLFPPPFAVISFLIFSLCICNFCFTVIFISLLSFAFLFLFFCSQFRKRSGNPATGQRTSVCCFSVCPCVHPSIRASVSRRQACRCVDCSFLLLLLCPSVLRWNVVAAWAVAFVVIISLLPPAKQAAAVCCWLLTASQCRYTCRRWWSNNFLRFIVDFLFRLSALLR